jgi:hypothetical protein
MVRVIFRLMVQFPQKRIELLAIRSSFSVVFMLANLALWLDF